MQSAVALHKESEEAMRGAHRLQSELAGQAEALKTESEHLQQRESQLASVSIIHFNLHSHDLHVCMADP